MRSRGRRLSIVIVVLLGAVACGDGESRARPNASAKTEVVADSDRSTTTAAGETRERYVECDTIEDAAIAYHQRRRGTDVDHWPKALAALRNELPADDLPVLDALRATASAPPGDAEAAAMADLDAIAQAHCKVGVTALRSPFAGIDVELPPRLKSGQPGWFVTSDSNLVEIRDTVDGHVVALVAGPTGDGGEGIFDVQLADEGKVLYFLEELGAFAHATWTVVWRVPLAGGPFELAAVAKGLMTTFSVSDDGWILYSAYSDNDEAPPGHTILVDAHGTDVGATQPGRWLSGHRLAGHETLDFGSSVAVFDMDDRDADGRPHVIAVFPTPDTPERAYREVVGERRSDGALLISHQCCRGDWEREQRMFWLDPGTGRELGDLSNGEPSAVALDATGRFWLLAEKTSTECAHACQSILSRPSHDGPVVLYDGILLGVDWW